MKIAIYGGSFNPPHCGHVEAALSVLEEIKPDKLIVVPANIPPHKQLAKRSPDGEERFKLAKLAFGELPNTEVSDIELRREGKSYTVDTLTELMDEYPSADFYLTMGTDMFLDFEAWHRFRFIMENARLAVFARTQGEELEIIKRSEYYGSEYGANTVIVRHEPIPISSTEIREMLCRRMGAGFVPDAVYSEIIARGDYDARPELYWLREKSYAYLKPNRVAHVAGCETEAVSLAKRWGEDAENAAEAAILHDITKKLLMPEQLILCEKYGIMNDIVEQENVKLMHAKTGAELSRELFNISPEVYGAIRWHTTGKPDMSLLEKIIYMADYIEPNRDFDGVEKLRALAYENLDEAMRLGLKMSLEDVRSYGIEPHSNTQSAYDWYDSYA